MPGTADAQEAMPHPADPGWDHPMTGNPLSHTLLIQEDGDIAVTLRLWQWVDCAHGEEFEWRLRLVEEPGTTATGRGAEPITRSYSLLESRWGADSPGAEYAAAVEDALKLETYLSTEPSTHPYAVPRCSCSGAGGSLG